MKGCSLVKLVCLLLGLLLVAVTLKIGSASAQGRSSTLRSQEGQEIEIIDLERRIIELNTHISEDDRRIENLQSDVTLYKGSVLGIGGVISLLELLQILGFVRSRTPIPK